jgi:quercetin dioxygenase-like cupin family protein
VLSVPAGELVFIPSGWVGLYRADPGAGRFVELAVVPHDYFDASIPRTHSEGKPVKVELPAAPVRHESAWGDYRIVTHNAEETETQDFASSRDTLLHVRQGTLTLRAEQAEESFAAGRFVVLPHGASIEIATSADYAGLALTLMR